MTSTTTIFELNQVWYYAQYSKLTNFARVLTIEVDTETKLENLQKAAYWQQNERLFDNKEECLKKLQLLIEEEIAIYQKHIDNLTNLLMTVTQKEQQ